MRASCQPGHESACPAVLLAFLAMTAGAAGAMTGELSLLLEHHPLFIILHLIEAATCPDSQHRFLPSLSSVSQSWSSRGRAEGEEEEGGRKNRSFIPCDGLWWSVVAALSRTISLPAKTLRCDPHPSGGDDPGPSTSSSSLPRLKQAVTAGSKIWTPDDTMSHFSLSSGQAELNRKIWFIYRLVNNLWVNIICFISPNMVFIYIVHLKNSAFDKEASHAWHSELPFKRGSQSGENFFKGGGTKHFTLVSGSSDCLHQYQGLL